MGSFKGERYSVAYQTTPDQTHPAPLLVYPSPKTLNLSIFQTTRRLRRKRVCAVAGKSLEETGGGETLGPFK